jgi:lysophospholipase L1-like esterase
MGSSSMKGWHAHITNDLAPLPIVAHSVNGSTMADALRYADSVVLPRQPRAVVIYAGDNDIARGVSPAKIAARFDTFVTKVHTELPACRIYFLSIKPSPARWKLWPNMTEANNLIAAACEKDARLTYVDVASGMLDASGSPDGKLFQPDRLHMNRRGYETWRDTLRPILLEKELP